MNSIGKNIAKYRKEKNITQEQLAEICNVSPQAVSKWENDVSCPDVTLLKTIARTFNVSVDALLDDGQGAITTFVEENKTKTNKLLKIRCIDGDSKVNVNLPLALIEVLLKNDDLANSFHFGGKENAFKSIDFNQILELVSLGVMGKLVEVEDKDGETVEVWVE
ncbi:MAG: helix-turn-helix transcriptional regulator [Clostridia bacterium]|nr:helix-turn-helix transcriptional regulator [Clostridia bacterium]